MSQVCKYFSTSGACAYGDRCTKLHTSYPSSSSSSSGRSGSRNGVKASASNKKTSARASRNPSNGGRTQELVTRQRASGSPTSPDLPPDSRAESPVSIASKAPCIFFFENNCKNGDDCDYSHSTGSTRREAVNDIDASIPLPANEWDDPSLTPPHLTSPIPYPENPLDNEGDFEKGDHVEEEGEEEYNQYSNGPNGSWTADDFRGNEARDMDDEPFSEPIQNDQPAPLASPKSPKASFHDPNNKPPCRNGENSTKQSQRSPKPLSQDHRTQFPLQYGGASGEEPHGPQHGGQIAYPHVTEVVPHWSQFADPYANPTIPFCKLLAQGKCNQGDLCRFRHSLTADEYTLLFHDQQPNLWTLSRSSVSPGLHSEQLPQDLHNYADQNLGAGYVEANPVASQIQRECIFFPSGKCRNGAKCPYLHVPSNEPTNTIPTTFQPSVLDGDWGSSDGPHASSGQQSRKPCRYFAERGACPYDTSCNFDHDLTVQARTSRQEPATEPQNRNDEDNWGTDWETNGHANEQADFAKEDDNLWESTPTTWGPAHIDNNAWETTSAPRKTGNCRGYPRGECHRGDRCRFRHEGEPGQYQGNGKSSANDGWPPAEEGTSSVPWAAPREPCKFFLRGPGQCKRGDLCRQRHDDADRVAYTPIVENTDKRCGDIPAAREALEPGDANSELRDQETEECEPGGAGEIEDQPSNENDHDDSWSRSWPDQPDIPVGTLKIHAPCKWFGQGDCSKGDQCRYLHISPVDPDSESQNHRELELDSAELVGGDHQSPLEGNSEPLSPEVEEVPLVLAHPQVERFLLNCDVDFASDLTPNVTTASDSSEIRLSNLPPDILPEDIRQLADGFGDVLDIVKVEETDLPASFRVEFANSAQALESVQHLNGQTYDSRVLIARLDAHIALCTTSHSESRYVRISWPNPSRIAWSHYKTVGLAKSDATRLNGITCDGRKIKATFQRPNQPNFGAIKLEGLSSYTSQATLEALCKDPSVVTMNSPTYVNSPADAIRDTIRQIEGFEDIDFIPTDVTQPRSTALATFSSHSLAMDAVERLNDVNQEYLGNQSLKAVHIYCCNYRITTSQCETLQAEIDQLVERYTPQCVIRCLRRGTSISIRIESAINQLTTFKQANTDLHSLLDGSLLNTTEGTPLWDEYFDTSSSAKALEKVNKDATFLVHCDNRFKAVRVFGSKENQKLGKVSISKLLKKVHQLRQEIPLERAMLSHLLNGGFKSLQDDLGANKVTLDVVQLLLVVRGDAKEIEKARTAVQAIVPVFADHPANGLFCEICLQEPVSPLKLSCRHAYCKTCLQHALSFSIHSQTDNFVCIARSTDDKGHSVPCGMYVPYVIIRDVLPLADEPLVLQSSFLSYIRTSPAFFFCPTLDCQAVYRVGDEGFFMKCSVCLSDICCSCRSRAHDGSSCEEWSRMQIIS